MKAVKLLTVVTYKAYFVLELYSILPIRGERVVQTTEISIQHRFYREGHQHMFIIKENLGESLTSSYNYETKYTEAEKQICLCI